MLDLFKLEWFRTWRVGIAFACVTLGLLAYYGRAVDLLQQDHVAVEMAAGGYALCGWLFGLLQMVRHRRPANWAYLVHRPTPPRRIGGAIVGAGALLLGVAVALPGFLVIAAEAWFGTSLVDTRHWLLPLGAFLIALSFYLAGAYAGLVRRPYAPLLVVLPAWLSLSNAAGPRAILVQLIVTCWIGGLLIAAFRADPDRPPRRPLALVAAALPVQMAVYILLLFGVGSLYQALWVMLGTHPLTGTPPRGGVVEASRGAAPDLIAAGLGPAGRRLRPPASAKDAATLVPNIDRLPVRGEMVNSAPIAFDDPPRATHWTFSHDRMLFVGNRSLDWSRTGTLTAGPLDRPPIMLGDGLMTDGRRLLRFDPRSGRISSSMTLPAGERLVAPPVPFRGGEAWLSDAALYARRNGAVARLTLPAPVGALERADLAPLPDGWLASLTFGRGWGEGRGAAFQEVLRVTDGDGARRLASRDLDRDFPLAFRLRRWWLSPLLHEAFGAAPRLLAEPAPGDAPPAPVPPVIWALAGLLSLIAVAGTAWGMSRAPLSRPVRAAWLAMAALVGLPALLSLFLFYPRALRRGARANG
jgi:hypothetical protein